MSDPQVPPTDAPIVLPYLPDPAVNGIALVNLPGAQPEQLGEIVGGVLRYRSPYVDVLGYLGNRSHKSRFWKRTSGRMWCRFVCGSWRGIDRRNGTTSAVC